MFYFMDSGPKFTGLVSLNVGGIVLGHVSFRFWISLVIPEIFAIKFGSCVKLAKILHVFGPKIFLVELPEFLDLHYKIDTDIDHVAKFRGDRMELGDPVANLKKINNITSKTKGLPELPFLRAA